MVNWAQMAFLGASKVIRGIIFVKKLPNATQVEHFGPQFCHLGNLKKVLLYIDARKFLFSPGTNSATKINARN